MANRIDMLLCKIGLHDWSICGCAGDRPIGLMCATCRKMKPIARKSRRVIKGVVMPGERWSMKGHACK